MTIPDTREYIELARLYVEDGNKEDALKCLELALQASFRKKTTRKKRGNTDKIVFIPMRRTTP
jgi:hypothetical protein